MPQQDPSRFEALKYATREKLVTGLAVVAGFAGGVAVAEQASAEPVSTPNTPEATASSFKQFCAQSLAKPGVLNFSRIANAGRYLAQYNIFKADYPSFDGPECQSQFIRVSQLKFQGTDPENPKRMKDLSDYWENTGLTNQGGDVTVSDAPDAHAKRSDNYYIKCPRNRNGRIIHKQPKARVLIRNRLVRKNGGKVLPGHNRVKRKIAAQKRFALPIRVGGIHC